MSDDLMALAERCEQARGDSFDLNHAIALALGVASEPFTASLDAAMTLVPEGWTAWELRSRRRRTLYTANISRLSDDHELTSDEDVEQGTASTPALALCAAALEARAQGSSQ